MKFQIEVKGMGRGGRPLPFKVAGSLDVYTVVQGGERPFMWRGLGDVEALGLQFEMKWNLCL